MSNSNPENEQNEPNNDTPAVENFLSLGQNPTFLKPPSRNTSEGEESKPKLSATQKQRLALPDRYQIERELGRGGMGRVYLAKDIKLGRMVAIKVMLISNNNERALFARFVQEMRTAAQLSHPNIVIVYDADDTASPPYLVMEYVSGGDLTRWCGRLPIEKVVRLGVLICDAMVSAHRAGVIHRDIKPANILLTDQGIPKLTDFGLAKQLAVTQHSATGLAMGTPYYMPPEQFKDAKSADARSDIFSLGATLYHLATGDVPQIIRLEKLPKPFADILSRALDSREKRYASGEEFLAALKSYRGQGTVPAPPPKVSAKLPVPSSSPKDPREAIVRDRNSAGSKNSGGEPSRAPNIQWKLFFMMVLQFFIWGAWLPMFFAYLSGLGFTPTQQSWISNAFPIAAIVGLFFSNQFADRNFAAEKFLAFSHLVGGVAILCCGFTTSFWPLFMLMLVHCLLYVPTFSITNSIAFLNMIDPQKEFGLVRMGANIGWMLAYWPFTFILVDWAKVKEAAPTSFVDWLGTVLGNGLRGLDATRWTFVVAGIASLLLAAYSMTLPHTPPKKPTAGDDKLAWLEAVRLLKHPYLLVLWLVTFVDAFVYGCYNHWTGRFLHAASEEGGVGIPWNWLYLVMSVGQIGQILTMFVLGITLKSLGWKWTMIVGVLGKAGLFLVYALFPENASLIVVVQILHGVCYAFFIATVYIFVDAYFPKNVRSSAQGLFNVMIFGVGVLVADSLCPWLLQNVFTQDGNVDYRTMFLVPSGISALAAVALMFLFNPPKVAPNLEEMPPDAHGAIAR